MYGMCNCRDCVVFGCDITLKKMKMCQLVAGMVSMNVELSKIVHTEGISAFMGVGDSVDDELVCGEDFEGSIGVT